MSQQQKLHPRRRTPRRHLIIALLLLTTGAVVWILNTQGTITGSWSSLFATAFTALGVIFGFFQWFLPLPPREAEAIVALQEQVLGQSSFKSGDETKYINVLEILGSGLFMVKCGFCLGKGIAPKTVDKYNNINKWDYTKKCPLCNAKGVLKIRCPDIPIRDLRCNGTGHEPIFSRFMISDYPIKRCSSCNGIGVRSLTGKVKVIK